MIMLTILIQRWVFGPQTLGDAYQQFHQWVSLHTEPCILNSNAGVGEEEAIRAVTEGDG